MVLLYLILPWLCVAAVPPRRGRAAVAERLVYGIALHQTMLLATGLALGLAHALTARAYGLATALEAGALGAVAIRRLARRGPAPRARHAAAWLRTRRGAVAALLAGGVAATVAIQVAADALAGTRHWDGLWYHVPRILFWMQQGSFDAWPTPAWQQIGLPVGGDVVLGAKMLLGRGWAGTAYLSGVLTLAAAAGVYVAGIDFGMGRWRALLASVLFVSFPAIGGRVGGFNSDVAAAFPVVAGYIALGRLADPRAALSAFLVLDAVGIACKPTVAPLAALVSAAALWRSRRRVLDARNVAPAAAASLAGAALVLASYWPVLRAFGDLAGGEVGRACQVREAPEFLRGALASALHWLLEPLGYLPGAFRRWPDAIAFGAYRAIGLRLDHGVLGVQALGDWMPMAGPDVGRSGLVPLALFPAVAAGLAPSVRRAVSVAWWTGFVVMSGIIYSQPWAGRFTVLLLAAYALAWAGTRLFSGARPRWTLAALAGLNVAAGLGTTVILTWLAFGPQSRAGGRLHYLDEGERAGLARVLAGSPLAVLTEESLDALLVGPRVAFPLRYAVCPQDGDWTRELARIGSTSRALALVHGGVERIRPGPSWSRPGAPACPESSVESLRRALEASGWRRTHATAKLDLWVSGAAVAASP